MYGWDMGGGWWMLLVLTLLVAIVLIATWAVSITSRSREARDASQRPLDILRERYARGEISQEEFEQAKRTLGY